MPKDDRITGVQVRGDHRGGNLQVFELPRIEKAVQELFEAVVVRKAESRNPPARYVPEANLAALSDNTPQGGATRISGAENAPDAAASNTRNRNLLLFEYLQNTQVGVSSGESAAQRQTNASREPRFLGKFEARI